jgi:beta-glucosidase
MAEGRPARVVEGGVRALLLLALVAWAGCGSDDPVAEMGETGDPAIEPPDPAVLYCGQDPERAQEVEARIDAILPQLSLSDAVALTHGVNIFATDGVWGVAGNEALGIPGFAMLDGPRGVSDVADVTATVFPVAMMRGATWDPQLERMVGGAIARELRATGGNVLLAPTINLLRHPRWGRAQETYGEDVHHLGTMGVAFIEGAQAEGVIATAKHFAANSIEDTRFQVDVTLDERTLREVYLPHFRRAVTEAHVGAVMSAYNSVNGAYADLNHHLLTEILKDDWGFRGFVMSDWIFGTHGDVDSLRAGLDVEMPSGANFVGLASAVQDGRLERAELDATVRRILRAQLCFQLDLHPPTHDPSVRESREHLDLALGVARRGIVLLKNDGGVLPIERGTTTRVAITGPNADVENIGDSGSSDVRPSDVVTALEGLRMVAGAVEVVHVDDAGPEGDAAIADADVVVIVAGLRAGLEGESLVGAGDRTSLRLPEDQLDEIRRIAALGVPTVVVLEGGAAIEVADWVDDVDALLMAWYPGSMGGLAIAEILFGDIEPSGRLPISFPRAEADLPAFDNVSLSVTYDLLHGYRWLETHGTAASFPFGHGLAYTSFEYAGLQLDEDAVDPGATIGARVDVTNTGSRPGAETVQLYVGAPGSAYTRAPKDLRAFAQVALLPGETRTVELSFAAADLAVWDLQNASFVVEPTEYLVSVGRSSGDVRATASLRVVEPEESTGDAG